MNNFSGEVVGPAWQEVDKTNEGAHEVLVPGNQSSAKLEQTLKLCPGEILPSRSSTTTRGSHKISTLSTGSSSLEYVLLDVKTIIAYKKLPPIKSWLPAWSGDSEHCN